MVEKRKESKGKNRGKEEDEDEIKKGREKWEKKRSLVFIRLTIQ